MGEQTACGDWIIVADGDDAVRALVVSLLARVGYEAREAKTGYEVLALASETRPRLVLLEVELTGVSGYEACSELRERYGNTLPVVFLSAIRVEPIDRIAGLLIGADDYVVKPFDPDELLARIRALVRRTADNGRQESPAAAEALNGLTPRERQVLDLLAQGHSQREIARELYVTPKTVATHIQRILPKLSVHSRAHAVALVLGAANGVPDNVVPLAR